jgi:hypothetical protein
VLSVPVRAQASEQFCNVSWVPLDTRAVLWYTTEFLYRGKFPKISEADLRLLNWLKWDWKIPLTQGFVALVDEEDYARVSEINWHVHREGRNYYAYSGYKLPMHRYILGLSAEDPITVDHRNGCGLDNRRSNLRHANMSQQMQNARKRRNGTSVYKGVSWNKEKGKWEAQIALPDRHIRLGYFAKEVQAARKYDSVAKMHFGEFAKTNFLGR